MGRAGSGVEVRGDAIRISFYYDGVRHRRTLMLGDAPMRATQANLKHATRLTDEIKAKIKNDTFVLTEYFPDAGEAGSTTVSKQLDTWLGAQNIETSTKAGYTAAANFWKRTLGTTPLRSLKLSQIKTAIADRGYSSGKTLNNYTSVLRGALQLAVSDGLMTTNPVTEIKSAKWQRDPPDPFEADERDKIIDYARKKYPPQVALFLEFWFWSGLRTSEILGLRWLNVDLASASVLIREAKVKRERKTTKTNSVRTLKLNSVALAALKAQKAHTFLHGEEVFQDPRTGKSWDVEANFRKVYWVPMLKALSMRYRRPYQCRHTYATAMLMAGLKPAFCAIQMGHSIVLFLTTYTKWVNGEADDLEMSRLESSISTQRGPKVAGQQP